MPVTRSSCSPEFGVKGVLDRFARIEPKVLLTADGYSYNGKIFDSLAKAARIVAGLESRPTVVVVGHMADEPDTGAVPGAVSWNDFRPGGPAPELEFRPLPFEHPLYIMYSSGTTGLPKCIVQSAGGVLINQLKEHVLHVTSIRWTVVSS